MPAAAAAAGVSLLGAEPQLPVLTDTWAVAGCWSCRSSWEDGAAASRSQEHVRHDEHPEEGGGEGGGGGAGWQPFQPRSACCRDWDECLYDMSYMYVCMYVAPRVVCRRTHMMCSCHENKEYVGGVGGELGGSEGGRPGRRGLITRGVGWGAGWQWWQWWLLPLALLSGECQAGHGGEAGTGGAVGTCPAAAADEQQRLRLRRLRLGLRPLLPRLQGNRRRGSGRTTRIVNNIYFFID
jgi:hypothetical protein